MKGNKGITLIALIVTIIVLIILAGVAIAMLTDDNGILKSASQARYDNIIGSVSEQVNLATLAVKTSITRNMVTIDNYIASANGTNYGGNNFDALVAEVRNELSAKSSYNTSTDDLEGFYVSGVLHNYAASDATPDRGGTDTRNGYGYITILYTSNSLRASLPSSAMASSTTDATFKSGTTELIVPKDSDFLTGSETKPANKSTNKAVIAYVIRVTNYSCELSKPRLISTKSLESIGSETVELAPELCGGKDKTYTNYAGVANDFSAITE